MVCAEDGFCKTVINFGDEGGSEGWLLKWMVAEECEAFFPMIVVDGCDAAVEIRGGYVEVCG